jgi:hypothetical protein
MQAGFYGTEEETYFVNLRGQIWCVQSPDLLARNGNPCQTTELPKGAELLPDSLCQDLKSYIWIEHSEIL